MSLQADFLVFRCFLMEFCAIKLRKSYVLTGGKFRELSPWLSRRQFRRCHEAHRLGAASAAFEKEGNCVFGGGQPCWPRRLRSFGRAIPPHRRGREGRRAVDGSVRRFAGGAFDVFVAGKGGEALSRFASDRRS